MAPVRVGQPELLVPVRMKQLELMAWQRIAGATAAPNAARSERLCAEASRAGTLLCTSSGSVAGRSEASEAYVSSQQSSRSDRIVGTGLCSQLVGTTTLAACYPYLRGLRLQCCSPTLQIVLCAVDYLLLCEVRRTVKASGASAQRAALMVMILLSCTYAPSTVRCYAAKPILPPVLAKTAYCSLTHDRVVSCEYSTG